MNDSRSLRSSGDRASVPSQRSLEAWLDGYGYNEKSRVNLRSIVRRFGSLTDPSEISREISAGVSPYTVKTRLTALRSWWAWNGLDIDEHLHLKRRPLQRSTASHWLTDEEMRLLLTPGVGTRELRDTVALGLGLLAGLRLEEIRCLTWSSWKGGTLSGVGKLDKPYTVGVPPSLGVLLRDWKAEVRPSPSWPVFCLVDRWDRMVGQHGCSARAVQNAVHRKVSVLNSHVSVHDLRRSYAAWLERKGVPIQQISMALRHEDLRTTQKHYLDPNPSRAIELVQDLEV